VSDPFATAAELSQFIGNPEPDDLSRMQLFLGLASSEIRRFTAQTLSEVAADVVTFPPTDWDRLILPERPVTAITSVLVGVSGYTNYRFTRAGVIHELSGLEWTLGATVTYNHGYPEVSNEYQAVKGVCLEAASRAYTLNERSASEAMGSTLMESAGYAPEVFLTMGEKMLLSDFGSVLVG
jgi:hypothetical protein